MDSDNRFWLSIWMTLGAVVVAIAVTIAMYYQHKNTIVYKMVQEGTHPIAASCAVYEEYEGKRNLCRAYLDTTE